MNVLLDTCIPKLVAEAVRSAGHDVTWTGEWEEDPGDDAILNTALDESRVLVTLDKDFGELAVVFGRPHCGILRLAGFRVAQQAAAVLQVLEIHGAILSEGAIITAEPGRLATTPGRGRMTTEHSLVVLDAEPSHEKLSRGDVGTVVHVYKNGQGYEDEFVDGGGHTVALVTVGPDDVRPIRSGEMLHTRATA